MRIGNTPSIQPSIKSLIMCVAFARSGSPLNSMFSSSSVFIFVFWVISPLFCAAAADGDNSKYYTSCYEVFACEGSGVDNLKYPFWGGSREDYCGQRELNLTCEDKAIKITFNSITYRVVKWDNSTQKLTVARDDFWGGVCAVSDYQNSSFDNTPFQQDDGSGNGDVTLFYNCPVNMNISNPSNRDDCGDGRVVYYGIDPFSSSFGCTTVVIPILSTQATALATAAGDINEALKKGFGLKWNGNYEECTECAASGGACGFDGGQFRCFCKDGPHTSLCSSELAPAPGMSYPVCHLISHNTMFQS